MTAGEMPHSTAGCPHSRVPPAGQKELLDGLCQYLWRSRHTWKCGCGGNKITDYLNRYMYRKGL